MTGNPNIVILISDEQRWDALGCNGNAVSHTPAIDDLAARGASFEHCQATYPLCCPSRMSIWTGLMPHDHHGFGNWRHLREDLRDDGLVKPFARAGYHTIYNGKWHVPGTTPARIGFADVTATPAVLNGLDRGRYIEEYRAYATAHGYDLIPGNIENLTPGDAAQLDRPGTAHYGTAEIPLEHFLEPWQTRRFVEQLERRPPDKPFLAVCSYNAPHFPMIVPAPYDRLVDPAAIDLPANFCTGLDGKPAEVTESAYRMPDWGEEEWRRLIAHYLGFCALIDAQVAQVMACLESEGLLDSTILVFTSDHGDMMGSHGLNKKGYPLHYEEALRVPLVIAGPGVDAGTRPEGLVSLLDLVPTLADLAGVELDSHHQGQSHRAALEGDPGWTGRPYLLAESFRIDGTESGAGDAVSPEEFDPARDGINLSIRTSTHRYIWRMHDRDELYDHRADPAENTNLAHLPETAGVRHELGHLIAVSLDETFPGVAQRIREEVTTDSATNPIA